MVFLLSLSDSKSPKVPRTLLSILAFLNDGVVWMVSIFPLISKSSSPFNNLLVTVPKPLIRIGIIATFMYHCFFNSLVRSRYLFFFFCFILLLAGTAKPTILQFFLMIIIRSGLLAKIYYYYYYCCCCCCCCCYLYYRHVNPCEIFTSAQPDGLSLESAWL